MILRTSLFSRRSPPGRPRSPGFSLIELMVALAIAAVLMRVAAPSVLSMMKTNRTTSEASTLVGDLQFARAEAVRRGLPVTLCPSSDGATCLGSTVYTWHSGWIVFFDKNGDGAITSGTDIALRVRTGLRGGDTFTPSPNASRVIFNREGFATTPTASTMFTLHSSDSLSIATRCVTLDFGGRASTQTYGQTNLAGTTCN